MEVASPERAGRDLSVLLLGCGSVARRHAHVLRSLGIADLRAFDPRPEQSSRLQREVGGVRVEASLEAALHHAPDAVFVLTPPEHHVEQSIQALDAGCHVFCEKPLAYDAGELDQLRTSVLRSGKIFMVGMCFRFHAGVRRVRELVVRQEAIGRIVSIRALMGEHLPSVRPDYEQLFSSRYLGAFDLVHDLDLALWFVGRLPRRVHAVCGAYSDIGIEAPDVAEIIMDFDTPCIASVHLDFFQRPRRRHLELMGTDGTLRLEFGDWDRCTLELYRAGPDRWERSELRTERDDMFRAEDQQFLTAVAEGGLVETDLDEGSLSVRVLEQVYRPTPQGGNTP